MLKNVVNLYGRKLLKLLLHYCTALLLVLYKQLVNPLSANPTVWSNTLKQFVGCC